MSLQHGGIGMFRELVRKNRQLPMQDCIDLLVSETRGVLSVAGDDGYPYGMPMNHWYNAEDGCVYFHCGKVGHRLDALRRCDKVSYCVFDQGVRKEGDWAYTVKSVILFGRIEILDDTQTIADIARKLSYKFTSDTEYIEREIRESGPKTLLLCLKPEHICGKLVHEA